MKQEIINSINILAKENEPFLFVISYDGDDAYVSRLTDIDPQFCMYDFEGILLAVTPTTPLSHRQFAGRLILLLTRIMPIAST